MDPGTVTGICIILIVGGLVLWLPILIVAPVIKALADRISGKTANMVQLKTLQEKVLMLEHEVGELRTRQLSIEDSQHFSQKLIEGLKEKQEKSRQ